MDPIKILIIATSHNLMANNQKTGIWLEEIAVPYFIFKNAGALITLASPQGGKIPVDPKSESLIVSNSTIKRFQKDTDAVHLLSNSSLISMQNASEFDIVFLIGGHGAMYDFYDNIFLKELLEEFNEQDKLIGAVSHGVTAFLCMRNKDESHFINKKSLTAFSNDEEKSSNLIAVVPFLLQTELIANGALYSKKPNYENYTVVEKNIITGQNPTSAKEVSEKLLLNFKIHYQKKGTAKTLIA